MPLGGIQDILGLDSVDPNISFVEPVVWKRWANNIDSVSAI